MIPAITEEELKNLTLNYSVADLNVQWAERLPEGVLLAYVKRTYYIGATEPAYHGAATPEALASNFRHEYFFTCATCTKPCAHREKWQSSKLLEWQKEVGAAAANVRRGLDSTEVIASMVEWVYSEVASGRVPPLGFMASPYGVGASTTGAPTETPLACYLLIRVIGFTQLNSSPFWAAVAKLEAEEKGLVVDGAYTRWTLEDKERLIEARAVTKHSYPYFTDDSICARCGLMIPGIAPRNGTC